MFGRRVYADVIDLSKNFKNFCVRMSLPQLSSVSTSTNRQRRKRGSNPPRNSSKVARVVRTQSEVSQEPENTHPDHTHPDHFTTSTRASTRAIMELDLSRRPISTSSESSTGSFSSSPTDSTDSGGQAELSVVDLTSDKEDPIVVDLTSPVASSAEVDLTVSIANVAANVAAKEERAICLSETDDSDVMILPSTPPSKPRTLTSPEITCPICMDSKRTFARSGRTLVSTKCGHLFCDACLKQSITLMHKCPTCSGKLTLKQFHRIYI